MDAGSVQSIGSGGLDASPTGITTQVLVVVASIHGSFAPRPLRCSWLLAVSERSSRLVSSRCPVRSGPRRHSAWIGWSLHLRVPGRAVPRRHQIGSSMPRFGRACFASPSIRGVLGGGLGVGSLRVEEHRSRGVRKKLKQMGREDKEKATPPPCQQRLSPQSSAHQHPPFFIHFPPEHRHTNPVRPKPNRQSHKNRESRLHHPSLSIPKHSPRNPPPIASGKCPAHSLPFVSRENLGPQRRLRPLFPELVVFPVDCACPRPFAPLPPSPIYNSPIATTNMNRLMIPLARRGVGKTTGKY